MKDAVFAWDNFVGEAGTMRKALLLNIVFILIFVTFLILSIFFWFFLIPFFFLPILYIFRGKNLRKETEVDLNDQLPKIRKCPVCGGEIREQIAKYCYHCGSKLNEN